MPFAVDGFQQSAVLVPLVPGADPKDGEDGLSLLLTVRPTHLRRHPGQIAFPGGKRDPGDPSLRDTALREAEEELGLSGAEVLGYLADIPTPAGFVITPVVGLVPGRLDLRPSADEVAETFLAPIPALRQVHRAGMTREYLGYHFVMHEFLFQKHRIWGATAAMIHQLLGLLDE